MPTLYVRSGTVAAYLLSSMLSRKERGWNLEKGELELLQAIEEESPMRLGGRDKKLPLKAWREDKRHLVF